MKVYLHSYRYAGTCVAVQPLLILHTLLLLAVTPEVSGLRPSPGCDSASSSFTAGKRELLSLTVGGVGRTGLIYSPSIARHSPSSNSSAAMALILNFHGDPSDAETQADYTEMDVLAEAEGFYVVYPQGIGDHFNAGDCCTGASADDLGFSRQIVDFVGDEACIDLDRVFATGYSNGGYMAYYLACRASDYFKAIASVGGLIAVDPYGKNCQPENPPPVLAFHDTGDPEVDYYYNRRHDEYMGTEDLVAVFAQKQGCGSEVDVTYSKGEVVCRSHRNCPEGKNATLCTITHGTHAWPNGEADCFEYQGSNDILGNEQIWAFFVAAAETPGAPPSSANGSRDSPAASKCDSRYFTTGWSIMWICSWFLTFCIFFGL